MNAVAPRVFGRGYKAEAASKVDRGLLEAARSLFEDVSSSHLYNVFLLSIDDEERQQILKGQNVCPELFAK